MLYWQVIQENFDILHIFYISCVRENRIKHFPEGGLPNLKGDFVKKQTYETLLQSTSDFCISVFKRD